MKKIKFLLPSFSLVLLLVTAALMVADPKTVSRASGEALSLCAVRVVPVLFPFLVLSFLLIASGAFSGHLFAFLRPLTRCLRFPPAAVGPLLIGALCGFPLGSLAAVKMYEGEKLTKRQAERLVAASLNTGPAFTIGLCGCLLFKSARFGILLYCTQLISGFLIAVFIARLRRELPFTAAAPAAPATFRLSAAFPPAVSDSAAAMLTICGTVVMFRVFSEVFAARLPAALAKEGLLLIRIFLECTGGISEAASRGGLIGSGAAGLAVGWSGVSVLLQCSLFTGRAGLSMKLCVLTKALQGLFCGAAAVLYMFCAPVSLPVSFSPPVLDYRVITALELALLTLTLLLPALLQNVRGRTLRHSSKTS